MKNIRSFFRQFSIFLVLLSAGFGLQTYLFLNSSKGVDGTVTKQTVDVSHSGYTREKTSEEQMNHRDNSKQFVATTTVNVESFITYHVDGKKYELITHEIGKISNFEKEKVALLYSVDNPKDVKINRDIQLWNGSIIPMVILLAMWVFYGMIVGFIGNLRKLKS